MSGHPGSEAAMIERSTSLFNFPTIEDVHRWKTQFESLRAEETEMKARHEAKEGALRTKVEKLGDLISAAAAFVEIGLERAGNPAQAKHREEARVTPPSAAKTGHRQPRGKTWTATILKIVEESERGMTYHDLKDEIGKTHLSNRLRETEKAFYSGIWKLSTKGTIVRYRGWVFSPTAYAKFRADVDSGLIDDLPETGASARQSPNEIAVKRFLASRPNGATTREIVDGLVNDPPSDLEVTQNRTSIYNLLSRHKKNKRLIERDGRYFLPSSSNETPGSNEPGATNNHGGGNGTSPSSGSGGTSPSLAALPGAIPAHPGE